MNGPEYSSKFPNKFLTDNQTSFLRHILFYHQGIGHPLAIIRILEARTYHYKKDVDLLNNLKEMYLLMASGRASDLEEEYGSVTSANKYNKGTELTQQQRKHLEERSNSLLEEHRKREELASDRETMKTELEKERLRQDQERIRVDMEAKAALERSKNGGVDIADINKLIQKSNKYFNGGYRK